jgi:hypothetical protein
MDWTASLPMPGQANTDSVTTAPPRSVPNWSAVIVRIGIEAFFSVCLAMTMASPSPLARAVRM